MKMPSLIQIVRDLGFIRLAGTEGEQKATEILQNYMKECGFKPKTQKFPIETFANGSATLTIGDKTIHGIPMGRCANGNVTAELIYTENPKVVNLAPERHRGKIIITHGTPRGIYNELKSAGIVGIIAITPPYKEPWSLSHRQYEKDLIPALTVSYDDGARLASLSGQKCTLKISQKIIKSEAHNVVVDIPGKNPDGTLTYLVGHYDSVSRSIGACDNAGGTAVLVKLAEFLTKNPPVRDVKIIFFSGEELGLMGSQAYCDKNKAEILKQGQLVINVDVSGDDLGHDELYITGTKELLGFAGGCTRAEGIYCNSQIEIYSSDSMPFAQLGVPSINIARYGGKASFYGHTPGDAPGRVSQRGLLNTYVATLSFLKPIVMGKVYPTDRLIDETLRPKIEAYLYGLKGKEAELEWLPKYRLPRP